MTVHHTMTDRVYLWRANKRSRRVHILDSETARAYCQVENCGGKPFDGRGAEIPTGRRLCGNCIDLAGRERSNYAEPNIKALMGERIAETEPELFAAAQATMAAMRRKQTRSARRSRGRKPKHSTAKYSRPFDDPLPW